MIKSLLAAFAVAAIAPSALAQTAPAQNHANHAAPAPVTARPTIASPIKDLLNNAETAAVMEKHMPGVAQHPMRPQFEDMTLAQVMPLSGGMITQDLINAIDTDLKALPAS